MHQHPTSPKAKRSFLLPVINEEELMKIVLLRRQLLPIGVDGEYIKDQSFFHQLEKKKRKADTEKEHNLREPTSTNVSLHQLSPRPAPKKLTPDAEARLELKRLDLYFHSGEATKFKIRCEEQLNIWCTKYLGRPRINEAITPPFDGLAFGRCLSEVLHITFLDDLRQLRSLIFGHNKNRILTQDEFVRYLIPLIQWESLFSEIVKTRKRMMERPISQLHMLMELTHNNCQPVEIKDVEETTLVVSNNNGKTFSRINWIHFCYNKAKLEQCNASTIVQQEQRLTPMPITSGDTTTTPVTTTITTTTAAAASMTLSQFFDLHRTAVRPRGLTALTWMKLLDYLKMKSWTRDSRTFEDLTRVKTILIPPPLNLCTSKPEFIRLMHIIQHFLQFRSELDEYNQPKRKEDEYWQEQKEQEEKEIEMAKETGKGKGKNQGNTNKRLAITRLHMNHLTLLIERYYKNYLQIFPNDPKYEHSKLEILEQLIHRMDAKEKTITVHDWLLVVQFVKA
jgi:hypothetical protein